LLSGQGNVTRKTETEKKVLKNEREPLLNGALCLTGSRTEDAADCSDIQQQIEATSCNGPGVQCGLRVLGRD
jgi:hypothetical protein